MMTLALLGTLIGIILGLRFTMLVLIPASAFVCVIAGASWWASGGPFGWTALELALFLWFLQIGYLCGAALQFSRRRSQHHWAVHPHGQPANSRFVAGAK